MAQANDSSINSGSLNNEDDLMVIEEQSTSQENQSNTLEKPFMGYQDQQSSTTLNSDDQEFINQQQKRFSLKKQKTQNENKSSFSSKYMKSQMHGCCTFVHATQALMLLVQITVIFSFGYFAYFNENENQCYAGYYSLEPIPDDSQTVGQNVTKRFNLIFGLAFWVGFIELLRSTVAFFFVNKYKNEKVLYLTQAGFCFTAFANIVTLVLGYMFRFDQPGKVCSGDYIDGNPTELQKEQYLLVEGLFLKIALIIFLIVTLFIFSAILYIVVMDWKLRKGMDYDYDSRESRSSSIGFNVLSKVDESEDESASEWEP